MTSRLRLLVSAVVATALGAAACGKKAPPLAPLVIRPAAPEDVQVVRVADTVHVSFKIPQKNGDGKSPASLARVEVYGLTGEAKDADGAGLSGPVLLREATKVGEVEVEPPPPPAKDEDGRKGKAQPDPAAPPPPPPPPKPEDPRPAQGEIATISETVTPTVLARYVPTGKPRRKPVVRRPQPWDDLPMPLMSTVEEPLGRMYIVVGRDPKGRPGALSARVSVPLELTPPTPGTPVLRHTETAIVAEWTLPPGALRPVFEPVVPSAASTATTQGDTSGTGGAAAPTPTTATEPSVPTAAVPAVAPAPSATEVAPGSVPAAPLAAPVETAVVMPRPLVAGPTPHTFNLYVVPGPHATSTAPVAPDAPTAATAAAAPATPLAPVNPAPLSVLRFEDPAMQFGVEKCYVLRAVQARPNGRVEGHSSPMACITPVDTFPPKAPRSLAAVGSEGAVNLIWEPNTEGDLGGYIVLRGLAGGGELTALTPTPIKETTYRDAQVTRGQRYVYAIVAVDTATPQNVSVESNRVEETAR